MKAMLCRAYGPPESLVLEEVDPPTLGARDVRIDVHAAGLNFPDLLLIARKYQFKPDMPFAPGAEVSGVVSEIGKDVEDVAVGDRVIATGGDDAKLDVIRTRYAIDAVVNCRTEPGWKDRVKALTDGNGADVIYDPIGGDVFETSLRCVNWNGRILVVGFASGVIPAAKANLVLLKGCAVVGVFWGAFVTRDPARNTANFDQLFAWYNEGQLDPIVSETMPLDRAAEAMRKLERREVVGKVVLTTGR
jgi:NADPH:quinone reductase-like Zn-dependent oxidoreductase